MVIVVEVVIIMIIIIIHYLHNKCYRHYLNRSDGQVVAAVISTEEKNDVSPLQLSYKMIIHP